MMQESKGCVRVPTTPNIDPSIHNPGLYQSLNGEGSCNPSGQGIIPCPDATISLMVQDGAKTLSSYVQGDIDAKTYYQAARRYNSGSIDPSGDLGAGVATHCYSSDIANRLTGWATATSGCTLDGAL
ncbi:MAG: hypothetical protein M1825_003353 [Sarcosagium campestre]|nr:MAG: hypothetical protein M1825_003353 [Sarcosagium campestre]